MTRLREREKEKEKIKRKRKVTKRKRRKKREKEKEKENCPLSPRGGSRNKFRPELTRACVCVREVITYRAVFHTECRVTTKAT